MLAKRAGGTDYSAFPTYRAEGGQEIAAGLAFDQSKSQTCRQKPAALCALAVDSYLIC